MKFPLLLFFLLCAVVVNAQRTVVSGTVKDAANIVIPFVSVTFIGNTSESSTNDQGRYKLSAEGAYTQIKFTYIGYKTVVKTIVPGQEQVLNISLAEDTKTLKEVEVTDKKRMHYSNKNNPAVELIRKVIENKPKNKPESYDYLQFSEYERIKFSVSNLSESLINRNTFKKYQFLLDKSDTARTGGKPVLPVFMEEKISQNYYRKNPEKKVQVITASKAVDFGQYLDQNGISTYLNRMYADVDIYSNNIFIVTNQFLSPVADAAPAFYQFFITDTVTVGHQKLIELSFLPRNKTDVLFEGKLYITQDGNYAVEKVKLGINKHINLNWVRNLTVDQDFEKSPDGRYHVSKTKTAIDFGVLKTKGPSLNGERVVSFTDYAINKPAPAAQYEGESIQTLPDAQTTNNQTWTSIRPDTLTTADAKIYSNIDSLKRMPSFKRTIGIASVMSSGFLPAGPVEIGPVGGFYSSNPTEGSRVRFGGRTTTLFSTRIYFESYGAYGFGDGKWKYFLSSTYAFNNKSIYTFPQNFIRASYQQDTKIPGQELQYGRDDNFLLSFKRGIDDKLLYNNTFRLDYIHEYKNHFSYSLGLKNWKQQAGGALNYINIDNGEQTLIPSLTTTELSLELRYAPYEQIFQGKIYRTRIPSKYPIIRARFIAGVKDLLGGSYNYQNLNLNIYKRFYLSQLGFTDITLEGSDIFGHAPYPLLSIHHANQTYSYQQNSYNMMNFLEFVSDHYVALNIEHGFNGFILNKVPLVKKLKLKETIGVKMLYGGLRSENNPAFHPALYEFPVGANGVPYTYTLGNVPYVEGNIGIGNIFKVLRFDLVKRFTYLNNPNVAKLGLRFSTTFDF